jgi:type I restriction enzyme S subunit
MGAVLRDEIQGLAIKTKVQQVCKAGQLIVAEIDAKVGGFAIIPTALAGAVVSEHYFLYDVDSSLLEPAFLAWCLRSRQFQSQIVAPGTTNYAAIRASDVLDYRIPLPSLGRQQEVVSRLDDLEKAIRTATASRRDTDESLQALPSVVADHVLEAVVEDGAGATTFGHCARLITSGPRNFGDKYAEEGVRFYRAQDIGQDHFIRGDTATFVDSDRGQRRARVQSGDLLAVITGATIGRSALVRSSDAPGIVSQHVGLIRLDPSRVLPEFGLLSLMAPSWAGGHLRPASYGQGKPGLNLKNLAELPIPSASLSVQRRAVAQANAALETVIRAAATSERATREINGILPSVLRRVFDRGNFRPL